MCVCSHQLAELIFQCLGLLQQRQVQFEATCSPGDMLNVCKDEAAKEAVAIAPGTTNGAVKGVQVSSFMDIDLAASLILCTQPGQGADQEYVVLISW